MQISKIKMTYKKELKNKKSSHACLPSPGTGGQGVVTNILIFDF
ncbi:MAG: hypothetical protein NTW79_01885 [Candidatus Berkelbacteria bacterium]|nr:hypothetical protein [Candidatus Berkelbacteria bacterium]